MAAFSSASLEVSPCSPALRPPEPSEVVFANDGGEGSRDAEEPSHDDLFADDAAGPAEPCVEHVSLSDEDCKSSRSRRGAESCTVQGTQRPANAKTTVPVVTSPTEPGAKSASQRGLLASSIADAQKGAPSVCWPLITYS